MYVQVKRPQFRRKYSIYFLILFTSACQLSCTYSSDEENFVDVLPNQDVPSVNLNEVTDTIRLYQPADFYIDVEPSGRKNYSAEVFVGDRQAATAEESHSSRISFNLNPAYLSDGIFTLKIVVQYSTGTGSLADQLDKEKVVVEMKYMIIIDKVPPNAVDQPTVGIEDGKLMVKWNRPSKVNFTNFMIVRTYISQGYFQGRDSMKITNTNLTEFHDPDYVGGEVYYEVNIQGYKYYKRSQAQYFNCVPLVVTLKESFTSPEFSYTNKLYNAANNIEVKFGGTQIPSTSSDPLTVPITGLGFGTKSNPYFYVAIKASPNKHYYSMTVPAYLGKKMPAFDQIIYSSLYASFYALKNNNPNITPSPITLYKLDEATMAVSDSVTFTCSFIPFFATSRNSLHSYVVVDRTKLIKIDLNTLDITGEYDLNGVINTYFGQYDDLIVFSPYTSLTDNDQLAFTTENGWAVIINMPDQKLVWYKGGYFKTSLSPDGEYLFANGVLYKGAATKWTTKVAKIASAKEAMVFREDTNKTLVFANGKAYSYTITDPPDATGFLTGTEFYAGYYDNYRYDLFTDTFIGLNPTTRKNVCFHASDFSPKEFPFSFRGSNYFSFIKNTVFATEGYYIQY